MDETLIKYILKLGIFVLLMFAFMNIMGINLNAEEPPKKLLEVVTIEGLEQPISTGATAFCDSYKGSSNILNGACAKLTEKNCNETSCCVFANNKCVAGNANGPTYNTGSNGITNTSKYYFQNQCFGANCPSV
jgi:hypothetical protein